MAPRRTDETKRLDALRMLELVGTEPSPLFDGFVRVARTVFDTPMAAVTLVDEHVQWCKAMDGMDLKEIDRDIAFCPHAILAPDQVMCVPDALNDPRFVNNPLVTHSPNIRFYAGAPVVDRDGMPLGALCVIDTKPRAADPALLERLRELAAGVSAAIQLHGVAQEAERLKQRDGLTGLPNRTQFDQALTRLDPRGATLFLLDLDNTKGVNDLFGHAGGDMALREAARRLQALAGDKGQVFRLDSDQFAILPSHMPRYAERMAMADRIHAALSRPLDVAGQDLSLRTSIGIAAMPVNALSADPLVRGADVALYEAKRAGRGRTRHARVIPGGSDAAGPTEAFGIGRIDLSDRLRAALVPPGNEPFTLVFQPVVNLSERRTDTMEALVRWRTPSGTAVSPGEFVVLAERMGLVSHLDRWVMAQACAEAASWPQPWGISVNVSAVSFGMIDVAAMVADALGRSGLAPARLTVEMTETALAGEPERARRAVEALRRLGVGVALDDFGAGHGSLNTLRRFPFTELKIDRALIRGLGSDPAQAHMVKLVTELGRNLGVMVVAEGVETPEELANVGSLGASHVQGRLLSWPVAADEAASAAITAAGLLLPPRSSPR